MLSKITAKLQKARSTFSLCLHSLIVAQARNHDRAKVKAKIKAKTKAKPECLVVSKCVLAGPQRWTMNVQLYFGPSIIQKMVACSPMQFRHLGESAWSICPCGRSMRHQRQVCAHV